MKEPTAQKQLAAFKKEVWSHYRKYGRHDLPWRKNVSLYSIVVSEIMLQQTQVPRVLKKYESWMKRFPDWKSLLHASISDVLREWSGLGYNRRALYLKRTAEQLTRNNAALPDTYEGLRELPGIGPNTAGAILAYAFNKPHPFIETNIRSAYIHFFFPRSRLKIPDTKLMPLIEQSLDQKKPREWYWALMDYGSHLKNLHPNPSRKSAHHVKQSSFRGSNRELRANILRAVLKQPMDSSAIVRFFPDKPAAQIRQNLTALEKEGFLAEKDGEYRIV